MKFSATRGGIKKTLGERKLSQRKERGREGVLEGKGVGGFGAARDKEGRNKRG